MITENQVLAKRFEGLDEDRITLTNDNPDYPEQKMEIDNSKIQQVLVICGKISSSLIPGHQIISNGKLGELEESV